MIPQRPSRTGLLGQMTCELGVVAGGVVISCERRLLSIVAALSPKIWRWILTGLPA